MPVLLTDDLLWELPKMHRVRQSFGRPVVADVAGAVERELGRPEIRSRIGPGARTAVAVGSRGIRNVALIVGTLVGRLRDIGAKPFLVSAMGSHGGGTPDGQREVLASYGITEEAMGAEISTAVDSELLGRTSRGIAVHFDRAALGADLVIPVNRIKPHTDFVSDVQSGLCKMLTIGLGNHVGCSALHEVPNEHLGETLKEAARLVMGRARVGFGLAVVENAYDETALVEALPSENLIAREAELLAVAAANMPALMIEAVDVLLVGEIGKNISGNGFDPHVLGRSLLLDRFIQKVPAIGRMVLLGLTKETHGNAIGIGNFDVVTRNVFDGIDLESSYANAVAVKCPGDVKIPLMAGNEEDAVRIAVKTLRNLGDEKSLRDTLRVVKIKNTLAMDVIEISTALLGEARNNPRLEILPQ